MRGMYSFRDYSTELQHVFIVEATADNHSFVVINGELIAWAIQNGLEGEIPEKGSWDEDGKLIEGPFGMYILPKHLPYLTHLPDLQPEELVSPLLAEYKLLPKDVHSIRSLYDLLTRFHSRLWYGRSPVPERFRQLLPDLHEKISHDSLCRAVCFLYDRHVSDENRYELLFHTGISHYLAKRQTKGDK